MKLNRKTVAVEDTAHYQVPSACAYSENQKISYAADSLKSVLTVQSMMTAMLDSLNKTNAGLREYDPPIGLKIVDAAMGYLGCRYGSGKSGPTRFDCSGFTSFIYRKFGVDLHRSSSAQFLDGELIEKREDIIPGDLVYFNGRAVGSRIGHVGIVTEVDKKTGKFYFIHAAFTGVQIDSSEHEYYKRRYIGARRIIHS